MQSMTQLKQAALTRYLAAKGLNPPQQEAVRTVTGPVSVLAGAGSGKTTAIVNRIAFMMRFGNAYDGEIPPFSAEDTEFLRQIADGETAPDEQRLTEILGYAPIPGWRILAITFTNKAAAELKARLETMLGESAADVWAATFHSACVRILRQHIDRLGYTSDFTIYDADDSQRVIKDLLKEPSLQDRSRGVSLEKAFPPKAVAHEISRAKDRLLTPQDMLQEADGDYRRSKIAQIYAAYQQRLKDSNAVDFDDIILLTVRLFREQPDVLEKYQNRCRYLLVDEYQDTNPAQYELIHLLAEKHRNLCVVGDDDQSIYKFRGATIENILSFESQFPDCKVIRLEQNYRSTKQILKAANSVIRNNQGRKDKTLWTDLAEGDKIHWYRAADQNAEARFVAETVQEGVKQGGLYQNYAVLYRTHALSNTLERQLAQAGIPYRIYGGLRFFDRKEIKDIVSYMCVVNNPFDILRFTRIINEPKRGIGAQTLADITAISLDLGISPLEVLRTADSYPAIAKRAKVLQEAADVFDRLQEAAETMPLDAFYDTLLETSGYMDMLRAEGEEGENRIENIKELKTSILSYINTAENEGDEPTLSGFLEEISLYTDQDRADESQDAMTLMTIHAAKGLEFENVFLIGLEEGVFPSRRSMDSPEEIEEERRLAYVAITRAKQRLYITTTSFRMLYGQTASNTSSRFLREMDPEVIEKEEPEQQSTFTASKGGTKPKMQTDAFFRYAEKNSGSAPDLSFTAGDRVKSFIHGEGTVLTVTPMGGDVLLEIAFDRVGTKKIMAKYARIRKVSS
ncbi:MAG: UvrD-helicase domain-containing protein [Oscillospiraceae bacterium]|nr:UvrD-helicase domain-containing protein [Oscillospiraceae bacterium]